jgi:pilus assembly protein CpaF
VQVPSALDVVDGEVRELIQRRGLDPFTEPGPVRVLVRDVVADYSERSLNSALPPIGDPETVVRDVLDRVAGYGPLQRYLDDPEIEEIWVNEPGRVFIARRGRSELTTTILAPGELADLVERMLRTSGRRIDMSTPFVDAMLPDGSRLHVVIPDITRRHMAVNIRKFVLQAHHLDELVALGTLTAQAARFLEAAVASGLNVLVSGGTQAGNPTMWRDTRMWLRRGASSPPSGPRNAASCRCPRARGCGSARRTPRGRSCRWPAGPHRPRLRRRAPGCG